MNKIKVLFVDDEIHVLNSIKRSTIDEDYEVLLATNGKKALELIIGNTIAVLVTDMRMPEMSGFELLKQVKEISPNTIRIVLSGYTQLPQILATINHAGIFKFITKPWEVDDFLEDIRESIKYYNFNLEMEQRNKELENNKSLVKNILKTSSKVVQNSTSDINSLKNVSKYIFGILTITLDKLNKDQIDFEQIKLIFKDIESIYNKYLTVIPTHNINFKIEDIYKDMEKNFSNKLNIQFQNNDLSYVENYNLISLVYEALIQAVLHCTEKKPTVVMSSTEHKVNLIIKTDEMDTGIGSNLYFRIIISILNEIIAAKGTIAINNKAICLSMAID